jgi:hypothetical protein
MFLRFLRIIIPKWERILQTLDIYHLHLFADSGGNIAHIFRVDIANQAGEGFSWTVCLHAGRQATFPKNARLGQMTM